MDNGIGSLAKPGRWGGGEYYLDLGALVVTHAMLRRLTSRRCIIIIIIIRRHGAQTDVSTPNSALFGCSRGRVVTFPAG